MKRLLQIWALFTLGCQAPSYSPRFAPVDSDGSRLRDQQGRALTLRGVNFKVDGVFDVTFADGRPPRETIAPFDASDVAEMRRLGFNVVRLPINWSAFESQPGQFSSNYLDKIEAVLALFRGTGIYVLIDLHEDGWSKDICEDGAPLWATIPAPAPTAGGPPSFGNPDCHVATDALNAFKSFFADAQMLQEKYDAMLQQLAMRFSGDNTVLGYEIMNEPIGDDDTAVGPFTAKAAAALRAVDGKHLIAFEPSATRNFLNAAPQSATPFPVRGALYSIHIYTPKTAMTLLDSVMAGRDEATAWHTPLMVTEAGTANDQAGHDWISSLLDGIDQTGASFAYWLWKAGVFDQDASGAWVENPLIVSALQRPYAPAIGGDPTNVSWDGSTLMVAFRGRSDVKPTHTIYWNGGQPVIRCDGKTISASHSDATSSLFDVDCGGSGDHTLTFSAG